MEDHARFESKAGAPGVQELRGAVTEDGVHNMALKRSHHRRWSALCSTQVIVDKETTKRSEVLFNLLRVQRERGSVDLYPSIVLLAWSLARSDEIDLSAIAVKREILQFVIAYCSIDL